MRRPSRRTASVERSAGDAERRLRAALSQRYATRLIGIACVSALAFGPAVASGAATTNDKIAATRRAADDAAQRWFDAQRQAQDIDRQIHDIREHITQARERVAHSRKAATERAVMLYTSTPIDLPDLFDNSALDAAQRTALTAHANARSQAIIDDFGAALQDLQAQERDLEAQQQAQQQTLQTVTEQRGALDNQLATLRAQARHEAEAALAAARSRAARLQAVKRVQQLQPPQPVDPIAPPVRVVTTSDATPVVTTPTTVDTTPPVANTGGTSSHHNDPFLVCTRARESSGNYSVVSGSGYYGAYQFLPSTWDSIALHAGRNDLVGVLPSRASVADQDEMAWALYQWQGKGPWGGRC